MRQQPVKILIIDDDPKVPWILSEGLGSNYDIVSARDGDEGLQMLTRSKPQMVLLDIKMPGKSGIEVLEKIKKLDNQLDVIMLSGHGDTHNIVESIRRGASEFINKPFDVKEVEIHIQNVLEKNRLRRELIQVKSELKAKSQYDNLVGDSVGIIEVRSIIEQVADSELTVLIRGESGTGKEIIARMIHALSARSDKSLIKVNCAAIPRDLLEAELFGYEKGAFTGAHKTKPGRFEVASKGTMFLDEIGDMPMELQSKLLQVLEQREFVRVGGIQNIKVDVRIVCATNQNLEDAIREGRFRDDLFYRLNEITIKSPPLRERPEDVPLLVDHFLKRYNVLYGKDVKSISFDATKTLMEHNWPGNVRQLENLVKQVVVRNDETIIFSSLDSSDVNIAQRRPFETDDQGEKNYSLKKRVAQAIEFEEKALIKEVLNKTNWNRRKAAEMLSISYRSLLYKIKDYAITN
ncbi:MAG: sigma-54-dependent Fis family transcriptional regulator [candidate division Zixibacteria bacterium]|nr:sigma-54-dependent Fis family transcriptional regulator [candidate division Zixibacteria bacterium]